MDGDDKKAAQKPEEAGWQYSANADDAESPAMPMDDSPAPDQTVGDDAVEWSASEYVDREKSRGWYAWLAVGAVVISAGIYLLTRDIAAIVVVVVLTVALGVSGGHKPRVINYRLDGKGLKAGSKFYPYKAYKSFTMPEEGPFAVVVMLPLKRFDFPASAYLAPDTADKAVTLLSEHLPMERGELDTVDRLMRRLHF